MNYIKKLEILEGLAPGVVADKVYWNDYQGTGDDVYLRQRECYQPGIDAFVNAYPRIKDYDIKKVEMAIDGLWLTLKLQHGTIALPENFYE